jgi:alanine dehydrogenase
MLKTIHSMAKWGKMNKQFTLGLGVIHAEKGEVRAFLPEFVHNLSRFYKEIVLETDYGATLGIPSEAYLQSENVRFGTAQEVYNQNYVLVLRYPPDSYLKLMPVGSCLISMCHFSTRPKRRKFLQDRQIEAISLDSITDDNGKRLVENLQAVAWNGCEIAFKVLEKIWPNPGLSSVNRDPVKVTILGSGGVGVQAVQASIRYGNTALWQEYAKKGVPGNIIRVVDYDLTAYENHLVNLLSDTHLLIDATQRKNPSVAIIQNQLIKHMPEHSVILDLSVDPYDFQNKPYEVKGIEGIPQGNLDKYIFPPDDPAWGTVPNKVQTQNRRWVVSCYSWPGIHPRSCMLLYGNQLSPLLRRLASINIQEGINPKGAYNDRAIARGMLKYWDRHHSL